MPFDFSHMPISCKAGKQEFFRGEGGGGGGGGGGRREREREREKSPLTSIIFDREYPSAFLFPTLGEGGRKPRSSVCRVGGSAIVPLVFVDTLWNCHQRGS